MRTQPEKIELILSRGCEYFGVERERLTETPGSKSYLWEIKSLLAVILFDNTFLTLQEVCKLVGYKQNGNLLYHNKRIKEELSNEIYGSKKTKMVYKELNEYIGL